MPIKNFIWYERYRPSKLSDLILPKKHKVAFHHYLESEDIPHLLFFGPVGGGKTTLAKILIKELPCSSITLNASSKDRGINTVKGRITDFASSEPGVGKKLKIVFLDEADEMSTDAKNALKNTIETHSKKCKFIFTANNYSKVTPAILSRTTQFEFSSFSKRKVFSYAMRILKKEDIDFDNKVLIKIIDRLYPDVRSIVNNLQLCSITGQLDISNISVFSLSLKKVNKLINQGKIGSLRKLWANAGSFHWLYEYLFNDFLKTVDDSDVKADIAIKVADYLYRDATIADKETNITACVLSVMQKLEVEITF